MRVLPLIKSFKYWFLCSFSFSFSIASVTTSLSSALSKKVPAYCKMSSGLSSRILRINKAISPFSSGCWRKYSSFCMRNSSYKEKKLLQLQHYSFKSIRSLTFFFSISFFWAAIIPETPIRSWLLMKAFSSSSSSSSSSSASSPAAEASFSSYLSSSASSTALGWSGYCSWVVVTGSAGTSDIVLLNYFCF